MKVKKSIDMSGGSCMDLIGMFQRKLIETCGENTNFYKNNMESFEKMLQEIVDKAFQLGQESGK
jgi:hypothetical protein